MVSTLDFEFSDPGSNPGRTSFCAALVGTTTALLLLRSEPQLARYAMLCLTISVLLCHLLLCRYWVGLSLQALVFRLRQLAYQAENPRHGLFPTAQL